MQSYSPSLFLHSTDDLKVYETGVSVVVQQKQSQLGTMRFWVQTLASSLSGLRILHCCELWCRLQTRLGSSVAVALATALIRPLAWDPPYAVGAALEKAKRQGLSSHSLAWHIVLHHLT